MRVTKQGVNVGIHSGFGDFSLKFPNNLQIVGNSPRYIGKFFHHTVFSICLSSPKYHLTRFPSPVSVLSGPFVQLPCLHLQVRLTVCVLFLYVELYGHATSRSLTYQPSKFCLVFVTTDFCSSASTLATRSARSARSISLYTYEYLAYYQTTSYQTMYPHTTPYPYLVDY